MEEEASFEEDASFEDGVSFDDGSSIEDGASIGVARTPRTCRRRHPHPRRNQQQVGCCVVIFSYSSSGQCTGMFHFALLPTRRTPRPAFDKSISPC